MSPSARMLLTRFVSVKNSCYLIAKSILIFDINV